MISIQVNQETTTIERDANILALIHTLNRSEKGIAVAVNNEVIAKTEWQEHVLREDDQVLIIQATQGG